MKKIFALFGILAILSSADAKESGPGNGGIVNVCADFDKDEIQHIYKIEPLDVYDTQKRGIDLLTSEELYTKQIESFLKRVKIITNVFHADLEKISRILPGNLIPHPAHQLKVTDVLESDLPHAKEYCGTNGSYKALPVFQYMDDVTAFSKGERLDLTDLVNDKLLFNSELFEALSEFNKAVITAHELVYTAIRFRLNRNYQQAKPETSRLARKLVGFFFARELSEAQKKEIRLKISTIY
ncbi:MAG: hypothetical protein HOE90_22025 [Bacteriovoracaceae bacterium]|jgi:hypothetical protein|nr:hypothetical protein [Bacteriovoracaceae bacterium]